MRHLVDVVAPCEHRRFRSGAAQLSAFTCGEDGLTDRLPAALRPSYSFADGTLFGVRLNGGLLDLGNKALTGVPLLAGLFHPDRRLLWLGLAFILCIYFFPTGIVGRLRRR